MPQNYKKAAETVREGLAMDDPKYSQAAYYLARTYNALFDEENAEKYFPQGHRDRPGLHGGAGQLCGHAAGPAWMSEEAIRQLNVVLQRDPQTRGGADAPVRRLPD